MAKKKSKAKSSRVPATKEPKPKPKADPEERLKPITLAPLSFDEAMAAIISAAPRKAIGK